MFRKFENSLQKKKMIDVIGVGDIIQFIGGRAYTVNRVGIGMSNIYLEQYSRYHPVPFSGDKPYEDRVWESIRHLNYEMKQKMDSIYSVTKTELSVEPDFYCLSVEEAHEKAIECDKNRESDV
ncbi:hypothetical protein VBD025_15195 [Virgibacillus flavescens]|uniref:hypothetical protein n=1 Tax=Virgibacillus flavescens TaxID=1611422 RepID=UPI003D33CB56